jgi:hypothetical protein
MAGSITRNIAVERLIVIAQLRTALVAQLAETLSQIGRRARETRFQGKAEILRAIEGAPVRDAAATSVRAT